MTTHLKMKPIFNFAVPQTTPTLQSIFTPAQVVDKINSDLGLTGNQKFHVDNGDRLLRFGKNQYLYACTKTDVSACESTTWPLLKLKSSAESFFTLPNILIMVGILVVIVIIIMLLKKKRQSYYYDGGYDFDDNFESYIPNRMGVPQFGGSRFNYY